MGPSLRNATAADLPFLRRLGDERRLAEWQATGLDAAQLGALLAQQFEMQQAAYTRAHPRAADQIIEVNGQAIGRLWLDRTASPWTLVDIALCCAWQGRGLGSACLRRVLAEAQAAGQAVDLQVDLHSPALRLYRRLGFDTVAECPPLQQMRAAASVVTTPSTSPETCDEQT